MAQQALGEDSLAGQTLGHYQLVEKIGKGGMGVVYRALDEHLKRDVAVKVPPPALLADATARQRFRKEALALSELNHPNIATIHDFDTCDGIAYLVEELIPGQSLDEMLAAGPLSEHECIALGQQMCNGLAAAHEHRMIHRDIKPGNIRVTPDGQLKILDFGLAKTLATPPRDEALTLSETQAMVGTFPYMSPEQLANRKLDARTDIWSAGAVLYEMATGQRPFSGTGATLTDEILHGNPAAPTQINHKLSPGFATIVQKCLEKDPGLRYQSAREIATDLKRLTAPSKSASEPSGDTAALQPTPPLLEPASARFRRWLWAAAALTVLAVAGVIVYLLLRPPVPVVMAIHQLTHTGRRKFDYTFRQQFDYLMTDGSRIYFTERGRVAEVSTAGGEVSYLDTELDNSIVVDISPNGSELLVITRPVPTPFWIVPLPAGAPRRIPGEFSWAGFLPGSSQIVYLQPSDFLHLFAADVDGGNARTLLQLPRDPVTLYFAISPDGRFVRYGTADGKIWESHIDGTKKHLFSQAFRDRTYRPNWTAGNRLFLLTSPKEGVFNVWAISEPGWLRSRVPQPVQLTFGPISFPYATASKDGKQIYAVGRTERGELSIYDAQAATFRKYLNGISAGSTDFSPDGQWVAYVTHPQGNLWRSRVDGSERLQLTFSPMGPILVPKWSPDGRSIVFMEWGDQRKIYLVSADGGAPMLLLSGDFQPADPGWSPDGKFLVYGGEAASVGNPKNPRTEIRILDLSTKQSKTVPGSQGMYSPRWSPDGRFLATESDDQKRLFLYSFENQHWEQLPLPKVREPDWVAYPQWSHDSRYLYLLSFHDVYKLSIPGGQPEIVATSTAGIDIGYPAMPWGGWFGLTPDDHILMMLDRSVDEVYALDVEYR